MEKLVVRSMESVVRRQRETERVGVRVVVWRRKWVVVWLEVRSKK